MTQPGASEREYLEAKLSATRRWNWALAFIAVCAVLYAAVADYQYKKTAKLAQRSFALGYLAAQFNALRNDLAIPSVEEFNFMVIKLEARSEDLGVRNPDTLRHYHIKPWEDYYTSSPTTVASTRNWTRRKLR